jgi:hypothetical protein
MQECDGMVDAFSFTNGNEMRSFKTRQELYDYMIERGEIILEGDDAPKFAAHVEKRHKQGNDKATAAKARLDA